jgi:hypothetical protein
MSTRRRARPRGPGNGKGRTGGPCLSRSVSEAKRGERRPLTQKIVCEISQAPVSFDHVLCIA